MIINMNGAKAPETPSSVLQEKTVTPETLPTVIGPDEGYDGLSQVTVNPDSQLIPTNIRSGKTIFGVQGTFEGVNTGNAIPNTELLSYMEVSKEVSNTLLYPKNDYILTYTQDAEPDTSSGYYGSSGIIFNGCVQITNYTAPLDVKLSYGVFKANVFKNSNTTTFTSSANSGKVSGRFNREYTGSPIYFGIPFNILRFDGAEYGVYEYNMHIKGYFTLTTSSNSLFDYIKDTEGLPMTFEGDIKVKYRIASNSADMGILDIEGLPNVELVNVTVGYPYSSVYKEHRIVFVIEKLYLNDWPTKVE